MILIIDYNDDQYKDIGTVSKMKIGQEYDFGLTKSSHQPA